LRQPAPFGGVGHAIHLYYRYLIPGYTTPSQPGRHTGRSPWSVCVFGPWTGTLFDLDFGTLFWLYFLSLSHFRVGN